MTVRECGPTHHACACQLERLDRLETDAELLREALADVDNVLGGWRRRLDSGRTIDTTDVHGLRLHVQTALGWPQETA